MSLSRILDLHSTLTKKTDTYYKEIQAWYVLNENGKISGVSMNIPKETEGDSKKPGRKKAFKLARLYFELTSLDLSDLEAYIQQISARKITFDDFILDKTTNNSPNNEITDSDEAAKAKAEYEKLCKETHEKFVNNYSDFNTQLTEFKKEYDTFDVNNPNPDLTPLLEKFAKHLINNQAFNPDMINDACQNVLPEHEPIKLTIKDIFKIEDKFNCSQISWSSHFDPVTFKPTPKLDTKEHRIKKLLTFFNTHLADENIINSFKDIFNNMYTEINKPSQSEELPTDDKTTKETFEKANEPEQEKLKTESSPKPEPKTNTAEKSPTDADDKTTKETSEKTNKPEQKKSEIDKTTPDANIEKEIISYDIIRDHLLNGTLEQTKELVKQYGINAWHCKEETALNQPEKLTLLYHLLHNRSDAKHATLKIHYLFSQQPDCSTISLMHAAINQKRAKHTSKKEQMLTNYIIAELINRGASPHKSFTDQGSLVATASKYLSGKMTTKETFWFVGVLANQEADYFGKSELHKLVLAGNFKELNLQLATSPKKANIADLVGNTPLHDAVIKINADKKTTVTIIKSLVEHRANINRKNKFGKTPWEYALCLHQNNPEILRVLKPEVFTSLDNFILNPTIKSKNLSHLVKITTAKELTPIFHSLAAEKDSALNFKYSEAQLKTAQELIYQQLYRQQQITRRWRTAGVIAAAICLTPISLAISIPLWRKAKHSEAIQKREIDKVTYATIKRKHAEIKKSDKQELGATTTSNLFNQMTGTFKKVVLQAPKNIDALEVLMSKEQAGIFDRLNPNAQQSGKKILFFKKHTAKQDTQKIAALQERSLMKSKGLR